MTNPLTESTRRGTRRGFGLAATVPLHVAEDLAGGAESAGFATFWVNDTPEGDGLALLQVAATRTTTIGLGVGLLPLDRWTPEVIEQRVTLLDLPVDRLTIGVGAGSGAGGLVRVRDGVAAVQARLGARVVVGALGPSMRRLAGEIADGVLLDWVDPRVARQATGDVAEAARAAGRARPHAAAYVFTALGGSAGARLRTQADYYASVPAYAAHFERCGIDPGDAAVVAEDGAGVAAALAGFDDALDETIVRAVTEAESVAAYRAVLEAARPG